jgi:hypothetical protein
VDRPLGVAGVSQAELDTLLAWLLHPEAVR